MLHSSCSPTSREEIVEAFGVAMNACDTYHRRALDNVGPAFGDGGGSSNAQDEKLVPT